jgi:hypothetical protein
MIFNLYFIFLIVVSRSRSKYIYFIRILYLYIQKLGFFLDNHISLKIYRDEGKRKSKLKICFYFLIILFKQ